MDPQLGKEPAPKSTDLDGWRQAIEGDQLRGFRLEAIAAAFQDLGQRDNQVRNALAKHLSASILGILRKHVGPNHPNDGRDIMDRVHDDIFIALLRPTSADGRNLREAFVPRLLFRMKDAIAKEERERRIPDESVTQTKGKTKKAVGAEHAEEMEPAPSEDGEIVPQKERRTSLLDGVRDTDQKIDVDRILERVPDARKRLAFHLYMNGYPYKSKRENVQSIAKALDISEKTAREWVEEVRQHLEGDRDVRYLKNGKEEIEYDKSEQS